MEMDTRAYLRDEQGHQSSMRLMAMLALLSAIALATIQTLNAMGIVGQPSESSTELPLYFLLAAFGGKVSQKFAESSKEVKE